MALDFSEGKLEVGRVWIGVDGAIEVIDEAADAAMEPSQHEEGGTPVDGIEKMRRERVHVGEGKEVARWEILLVGDAAESVAQHTSRTMGEMPMDSGRSHGVGG